MMSNTLPPRPLVLRIIYALAGVAVVVWTLTLVIGLFAPGVTVGLAGRGGVPSVWSRDGAALAIMTALAAIIALGIRRDRGWTQPFIPLVLAVDPLVDGLGAQPLSLSRMISALSGAAVMALILYWRPSSRRYYAGIAAHERGTVPSFTS